MNQQFNCPYCGQYSYAKSSKKSGNFESWKSVIRHISKCSSNNKAYIVDLVYGPISVDFIRYSSLKQLQVKYPNIKLEYKLRAFKKEINDTNSIKYTTFSKEAVISGIKKFVEEYGRIPQYREADVPLEFRQKYLPDTGACKKYFGSWNAAIKAAGFVPNIQNGFGYDTYGLDGHLYRSQAEAYFADTYLFNKYDYIVEPKYPKPYNKYYDWHIPSLDLYIELDGGIRPETTKEKIKINSLLNRHCLFINTSDIYNCTYINTLLS